MKISRFSSHAEFKVGEPTTFEASLPDSGHIVDAVLVYGNKTANLDLVVVHDVDDSLSPLKLIVLTVGQEHPDVREYEFVQKIAARKFTSAIGTSYLFAAPRGE